MRHGRINLDLTTEEYLTNPTIDPHPQKGGSAHLTQIHAGDHIVRDGKADSHWIKGGGHPGGRPLRVAVDGNSGKMFVRVAEHIPSDITSDRHAAEKERIENMKPFHVPGAGFWVPLDEMYPNHPHAAIFNS
jgi:hypothetical protein